MARSKWRLFSTWIYVGVGAIALTLMIIAEIFVFSLRVLRLGRRIQDGRSWPLGTQRRISVSRPGA